MILVTGASGHIGNVLAALLYEKGYRDLRLMAQSQNTAHIEKYAKEIVHGDIRDPEVVSEAVRGCSDVFHLAGYIHVSRTDKKKLYDINVGGTENVIQACLAHSVRRLVHVSSIHALSPVSGSFIDESVDVKTSRPGDEYGRSKLMATTEVMAACEKGLDAVVVYPTSVIGPYDYRCSMAGSMFKKYIVAHGRQLCFNGGYDFVDVRDVADGIFRAWQQGEKGQGYILSGDRCTLKNMIETLGQSAGNGLKTLRLPLPLVRFGAALAPVYYVISKKEPIFSQETVNVLISDVHVSSEKARRHLGFESRPLSETMDDVVRWYREDAAAGQ